MRWKQRETSQFIGQKMFTHMENYVQLAIRIWVHRIHDKAIMSVEMIWFYIKCIT
jgi:hypothetical protein